MDQAYRRFLPHRGLAEMRATHTNRGNLNACRAKGTIQLSPRIVPGLVTRGMRLAAAPEEESVSSDWPV